MGASQGASGSSDSDVDFEPLLGHSVGGQVTQQRSANNRTSARGVNRTTVALSGIIGVAVVAIVGVLAFSVFAPVSEPESVNEDVQPGQVVPGGDSSDQKAGGATSESSEYRSTTGTQGSSQGNQQESSFSSSGTGGSSGNNNSGDSGSNGGTSSTKSVKASFKGCQAGDLVYFGNYGNTAITWRVLSVSGNTALVVTENVIDAIPYNKSYSGVTWEKSYLRTWMNGTFYNSAFTSSQASLIVSSTITNENNSSKGTSGGNNTKDKIFALSASEVRQYFSSNSDRLAYPTDYAKKNGVQVMSSGATPWWLRTPGATSKDAMYVWGASGDVDYNGYGVDQKNYGARPAMYVSCS